MRHLLKKSTFAFLLLGALLFIPHMGECRDGTYVTKALTLDRTPKTGLEIQGQKVRGYFHTKEGRKVLIEGHVNSDGTGELNHYCSGPCPKNVAKSSKFNLESKEDGSATLTAFWIDSLTKKTTQTNVALVPTSVLL